MAHCSTAGGGGGGIVSCYMTEGEGKYYGLCRSHGEHVGSSWGGLVDHRCCGNPVHQGDPIVPSWPLPWLDVSKHNRRGHLRCLRSRGCPGKSHTGGLHRDDCWRDSRGSRRFRRSRAPSQRH